MASCTPTALSPACRNSPACAMASVESASRVTFTSSFATPKGDSTPATAASMPASSLTFINACLLSSAAAVRTRPTLCAPAKKKDGLFHTRTGTQPRAEQPSFKEPSLRAQRSSPKYALACCAVAPLTLNLTHASPIATDTAGSDVETPETMIWSGEVPMACATTPASSAAAASVRPVMINPSERSGSGNRSSNSCISYLMMGAMVNMRGVLGWSANLTSTPDTCWKRPEAMAECRTEHTSLSGRLDSCRMNRVVPTSPVRIAGNSPSGSLSTWERTWTAGCATPPSSSRLATSASSCLVASG
mmetsp:Transcript_3869/g.7409  ORF Transcript_3869/g.7409 Transcript_3869/m.7409 type:complete len:303 (-) Transcript_3869:116-1024(-)